MSDDPREFRDYDFIFPCFAGDKTCRLVVGDWVKLPLDPAQMEVLRFMDKNRVVVRRGLAQCIYDAEQLQFIRSWNTVVVK